MNSRFILHFLVFLLANRSVTAQGFVHQAKRQFILNGKPYYYIGANYWFGSYLGLRADSARGIERLRAELDFLKAKGVANLRVLAGAEGAGLVNGVERVGPPLQPDQGRFDNGVLKGLDILLDEMGKRQMKAVVFLSNNWEWSGGFLQYLRWNHQIDDTIFRRKMNWDELRDAVSRFYACDSCISDYKRQVAYILEHRNVVNGRRYSDDPTIMAWELANEPRPMRPAAVESYKKWISGMAAFIKQRDPNHLVTTGVEGEIGTEGLDVFESIHGDKNIDYLTIHIWPKNWNWFRAEQMAEDLQQVEQKTSDYINAHIPVAERLRKPLVVEEFGLPRDGQSFDPRAATTLRDRYYRHIFSIWAENAKAGGVLAGVNFWAFGGKARPVAGQVFWKAGDDYMGDPPMEEQGLNSVFDSDRSTWDIISRYARSAAIKGGQHNANKQKAH